MGEIAPMADIKAILEAGVPDLPPPDEGQEVLENVKQEIQRREESESGALGAREESEQPEEEQAEDSQEAEEQAIAYFNDLADSLGVPEEELYALKVKLGEGMEASTIGQLKDLYKDKTRFERERDAFIKEREERQNAFAQERQAWEQDMAQRQAYDNAYHQAEGEVQYLQAMYQQTDWNSLEAQDPANAALQRQKLNDALTQAQYRRDQIAQTSQAQQAQQQQAVQEQARRQMLDLIPDWRDQGTFDRERRELVDWLGNNGISERQAMTIMDPVVIKFLRDQMQKTRAVDDALKKGIKPPPKSLKPSVVRNTALARRSSLQNVVDKAKESRDTRDKTRAVSALLASRGID